MNIEVDLIRHVKVNGEAALYGISDVAPNVEDNEKLLNKLVKMHQNTAYDLVIGSPLKRSQWLARSFAQHQSLPIKIVTQLQEMNFGVYDGVAFKDLFYAKSEQPTEQQPLDILPWSSLEKFFYSPNEVTLPKAEALEQFHHRITTTWHKLLNDELCRCNNHSPDKPKRILCISHGGVIRMLLANALNLDWRKASWHQQLQIANGSLTKLHYKTINNNHIVEQEKHTELYAQVSTIAAPLFES